jgi:HEAT repeat protein
MDAAPVDVLILNRPAGEWLGDLRHADPDAKARAAAAWRALAGPLRAALPGLVAAVREPAPDVRREAVAALGALGQVGLAVSHAARAALTAAAKVDADEAVRARALDELLVLGPLTQAPLPALVEALHDRLAEVRRGAAEAIGDLGSAAKSAVGALTAAQYDPDPGVLVQVARALWRVDRRDRIAVPLLVGVLGQGDEVLRWQAAEALGEIGPAAADAAPALRAALRDEYQSALIRQAVATALRRIDPPAAAAAGVN